MRSSEVCRYGPALNDKWILWAHDIFGVDSGRTKEYCNKMWTGAVQWLVELFNFYINVNLLQTWGSPASCRTSSGGSPGPAQPPPGRVNSGRTGSWGCCPTCWSAGRGAWRGSAPASAPTWWCTPRWTGTLCRMVTLMWTLDQELGGDLMRGGVSLHPSHPPMMADAGEDAATIYSNIRSPQYFMATSDTSDTLRPGGLADQLIETVRSEEARLVALHAYTTYTRHNTLSPADVFWRVPPPLHPRLLQPWRPVQPQGGGLRGHCHGPPPHLHGGQPGQPPVYRIAIKPSHYKIQLDSR